ncbi:hypothetical protein FSC37_13325 [Piscinibacter aquaticus]|uniref:Uncharacterized protein n=1 Tax=Piscinibacter aquaticus TaxID=392597 RepID=A0A5C6U3Y4_9BURK|nr:hypothetical protein FSC37_13325 [Piscinibacter aquaticus]
MTKTLQPGEPGTLRLLRAYGDQLVCVRYRTSGSGEERLTTVELVIDRTVIRKRGHQIVAFKIYEREARLRREALKLGAWFDATTGLWNLARHDVLHLGLRHRIAIPREQMLREEMSSSSNKLPRLAK